MELTSVVANKCFNIFVRELGTPDIEYLRWAFIRSVSELKATSYRLDSNLGITGRFNNGTKGASVSCDKSELNSLRQMMIKRVNQAIRAITHVKPATKIKRIRINANNAKPAVINISHEKAPESTLYDAAMTENAA